MICEWCGEEGSIHCYRDVDFDRDVEVCEVCLAAYLREHYPDSPALKNLKQLYGEEVGNGLDR